jgi:hypothetical protein
LHEYVGLEKLDGNLDPLKSMRERLPRGWWTAVYWPQPIEIAVDGSKVRNTWKIGDDNVFNGKEEVQYDPNNNQVSIYPGKTGLEKLAIDDLRILPHPALDKGLDRVEIVDKRLGRVSLRYGDVESLVEVSTGFVHSWLLRNAQNHITRERLQQGPVVYPGGIVFPSVAVDIWYNSDFVSLMSVYAIEKMQLNIELPPATFTIGGRAGLKVIDYRQNLTRPTVRMTQQHVQDVIEFANTPSELLVPKGTSFATGTLSTLLALFATLAIFAGVVLWRRSAATS